MSGCHGKNVHCEKDKHPQSKSNGLMSSMRFMNIKCFENAFFSLLLEISTFVPYHLSLVVFVRLGWKKVPMSNRRKRKTVHSGPLNITFSFGLVLVHCVVLLGFTRSFFSFQSKVYFWSIFINHIYVSWKLHWIRKSNALHKELSGLKQKVFCFHWNLWLFILDLMHS